MIQNNIDQAEIQKFSEHADEWWNKDGEFKTLHEINPIRLEYLKKFCNLKDAKIVDVGCGGGILSESLAKEGAHVTGIDMSDAILAVAKKHAKQEKLAINYQLTTIEDFASHHPEKFDIVVCMELLEHVPDPQSVVNACRQLVKPQGHVFFSTINRNLKSYLLAIVAAEYILQLLPKQTHDYDKFIRPSELAAMARTSELIVKDLTGFAYNPLTHQSYLTKSSDVNYLLHCQRPGS